MVTLFYSGSTCILCGTPIQVFTAASLNFYSCFIKLLVVSYLFLKSLLFFLLHVALLPAIVDTCYCVRSSALNQVLDQIIEGSASGIQIVEDVQYFL